MLYMQRCQRQDLGPLSIPKFCADHTRQPCADRISVLVDEDASIVVEFDEASVFALLLFPRSYYHGVSDVAPPYFVRDANTRATGAV